MNLYDKILNIKGIDLDSALKKAITKTKQELNNLDYERMCLVYNSYLYNNLKELSVLSYIVDTEDLGYPYKHRFIIVIDTTKKFLLDLTFKQFKSNDVFSKLCTEGYQEIDELLYNKYLSIVTGKLVNNADITNSIMHNKKNSR